MKKVLSVALSLVMVLSMSLFFTGCGEDNGGAEGETYTFRIAHLQTEQSAAGQSFQHLKETLEEKSSLLPLNLLTPISVLFSKVAFVPAAQILIAQ